MATLAAALEALTELGPQGIARFQASLDIGWVEQALEATGKASIRRRKLPADQAVWLVLGMGLFEDRSIRDLVDHLSLVLPGTESLAPSAVSQARYRLGPEPMAYLFRRVAEAWADTPGLGGYKGLSLHGVDGTCVRVQDSDENFGHFGKPGGRGGSNDAGYPQLRLACLLNLSTRLLSDAQFGPYQVSEQDLAAQLWERLPANSLTILDRGFVNYPVFASLLDRGDNRHFMVRMRQDMKVSPVVELADGTLLAKLRPRREARRQNPSLRREIEGRLIAHQHPDGQPSRLFTTLIDCDQYPADELIELYHERWECEIAYDELKTHMIERKECLRSKRPDGVEQELWGLLLVYNLVRREMLLAAQEHGLPPKRISFRSSLMWIRNFWLTASQTAPGNIPKHLGHLRSTLDVLILPPRRSQRRYPRHVKIKMSNYKRNRGRRKTDAGDLN